MKSLVLLFLLIISPLVIAEECYKKVLNQFCLGGDIIPMIQKTRSEYIQQENNYLGVIVPKTSGNTYVMAYNKLIYKVLLTFRPETNTKFKELRNLLESKYGIAQDLSYYPKRVKNEAGRFGAIRRGEGEARWMWSINTDWRIELFWNRTTGLALAYIANSIDKSQKEDKLSGL